MKLTKYVYVLTIVLKNAENNQRHQKWRELDIPEIIDINNCQLIFLQKKKKQIEITRKNISVHSSGTTKYPYGGVVRYTYCIKKPQ